jgi:ABC-2 type transport system permease protein
MMSLIKIEWLHFSRNKAKPIAVLLFFLASVFGIYNGVDNYTTRLDQIAAIEQRVEESYDEVYQWLDQGKKGPEGRPWVDIQTPFWAMWYGNHYVVDEPSAAMIFNIGQSQHFGYYKRVSMWTTAYDDDLTAEIANPELVQLGALDFTFVWLYLMPILLIVLTYQIRGLEQDLGLIPILRSQVTSLNNWLMVRLSITGLALLLILSLIIGLPALFIPFKIGSAELVEVWTIYALYLLIWVLLAYLIISFGKGQADQALKMIGVWLLLTVVIPGSVNQYVLIEKPADLMMSMIEAGREGQDRIFDEEESVIKTKTLEILPDLAATGPARIDSLMEQPMINGAYRLVLNDYMNNVTDEIIEDQDDRNTLIRQTYWFNPITGFHNWLNNKTRTGHQSNIEFRLRIKEAGTLINKRLVMDEWNKRVIDRSSFDEYVQFLGAD